MRNRRTKSKLYRALKREASKNRLYNTTKRNRLESRLYDTGRERLRRSKMYAGWWRKRGRDEEVIHYILTDSWREYVEVLEEQYEIFEKFIERLEDRLDRASHNKQVEEAIELIDDIKTCVNDFCEYLGGHLQEVESMEEPALYDSDLEILEREIVYACDRLSEAYDKVKELEALAPRLKEIGLDIRVELEELKDMLGAMEDEFEGVEFENEEVFGFIKCSGIHIEYYK